jgi:hypothetical protein
MLPTITQMLEKGEERGEGIVQSYVASLFGFLIIIDQLN